MGREVRELACARMRRCPEGGEGWRQRVEAVAGVVYSAYGVAWTCGRRGAVTGVSGR